MASLYQKASRMKGFAALENQQQNIKSIMIIVLQQGLPGNGFVKHAIL